MKLPVSLPIHSRSDARRAPVAATLRAYSRLALSASISGFLAIGLVFLGREIHRFVYQSDYFMVREIRVTGASGVLEDQVRAIIQEQIAAEPNLVRFSTGEAGFRIETLPRVRDVEVEKVWPGRLVITIQEREALTSAHMDEFFWVDREGIVIDRASTTEVASSGGPIVTGVRARPVSPGAQLDQPRLSEVLRTIEFLNQADPRTGSLFAEWNLGPDDEVTGILTGGVEVRFGAADPSSRLRELASLLRQTRDWERFTCVDLRFDSRIVCF